MYGCIGSRYLKDDEKLLFKQKIKVSRHFDNYEIGQLLTQRPNRRFPIVRFSPYVWFYQSGIKQYNKPHLELEKKEIEEYYDSLANITSNRLKVSRLNRKKNRKITRIDLNLKEGNLLMRWGEPLAIYDTNSTLLSLNKLTLYMHSMGYFNAEIKHEQKNKRKKITSTFSIIENTPYTIDTVYAIIKDKKIEDILKERKSLLKKGENYNQTKLKNERDDITNYLKDRGYYDFNRQYIRFEVDSTVGNKLIALRYFIQNKQNKQNHKQFVIDSVNFTTDAHISSIPDSLRLNENYNKINYQSYEKLYKSKILDRRIFLYSENLYSRSETYSTQRQLANLDVFKFININYDSTDGKFIANIFTRPLPRHQWANEFGVNVTQNYPGPFYNTSFKKRNVFKGLENFEVNGRIGFEGVISATDANDTYSIEAGLNASLIFPQFVMPFSNHLLSRIGSQNPKTRFTVGYSLTDRIEYKRNNLNFNSIYTWQKEQHTLFSLSVADISLINSELDSEFEGRLIELRNEGSNLYKTFQPSFVSSITMQASKNFNNYGFDKSKSAYLRILAESGGASHFIIDQNIYENKNLETYQFLKFNIDFRRSRPLINQATLAFRINTGIAIPYSDNNTLPYEKYFFAGGSNGIRGWRPRRLGPGSFNHIDPQTNSVSYQSEQQGEILLEASIEFRQNLFGFVDWAYFIDAGNIWTIEEESNRLGGDFIINRFYKEIAIASGFGIRFDFNFLIIRFDAGVKINDPARPLGKRFVLNEGHTDFPFNDNKKTEPIILNIGIGYPF
ncbi:MAG: BamA/TamA family outer membrane protein [Cyclobacteriaceae bacterium]|nr:BamA/TamA family outer membrane protein [Cyclobacteriaceae bacterium]